MGQVLVHHVADSHEWRPLPFVSAIKLHDITVGPVTIPVTEHVVMLCIVACGLSLLLIAAFGRSRLVPNALGAALEPIVLFVREGIVLPTMGKELGERWLPFFYTLFFFLVSANLLGLVPLFPTVTANLAVTGALALMVFVAVVAQGVRANGPVGFFAGMAPEGIPRPIAWFLVAMEAGGLVVRSGVLAIRLFANMIAGHFVIFSLLMLMVLVHPTAGIVSVPMALFIDVLEVLVAVIQAVVFTMLSAIFIGMAGAHHGAHDHATG